MQVYKEKMSMPEGFFVLEVDAQTTDKDVSDFIRTYVKDAKLMIERVDTDIRGYVEPIIRIRHEGGENVVAVPLDDHWEIWIAGEEGYDLRIGYSQRNNLIEKIDMPQDGKVLDKVLQLSSNTIPKVCDMFYQLAEMESTDSESPNERTLALGRIMSGYLVAQSATYVASVMSILGKDVGFDDEHMEAQVSMVVRFDLARALINAAGVVLDGEVNDQTPKNGETMH